MKSLDPAELSPGLAVDLSLDSGALSGAGVDVLGGCALESGASALSFDAVTALGKCALCFATMTGLDACSFSLDRAYACMLSLIDAVSTLDACAVSVDAADELSLGDVTLSSTATTSPSDLNAPSFGVIVHGQSFGVRAPSFNSSGTLSPAAAAFFTNDVGTTIEILFRHNPTPSPDAMASLPPFEGTTAAGTARLLFL